MEDTTTVPVLHDGYVRLVDALGSDLSVVNAARVSYDKESTEFDERDDKLLAFLLREGHTSPLRHAFLSFEIYAPLMVARQWWKYVIGSSHQDNMVAWNESSRRYITEDAVFHIPLSSEWRAAPENSKQGSGGMLPEAIGFQMTADLTELMKKGEELYERAMQLGVAPEQARLFLPAYGLYVRWRWSASLGGVLHFLSQRLEHDAQFEIQEFAKAVYSITSEQFPRTTEAWSRR